MNNIIVILAKARARVPWGVHPMDRWKVISVPLLTYHVVVTCGDVARAGDHSTTTGGPAVNPPKRALLTRPRHASREDRQPGVASRAHPQTNYEIHFIFSDWFSFNGVTLHAGRGTSPWGITRQLSAAATVRAGLQSGQLPAAGGAEQKSEKKNLLDYEAGRK
jgi:hypothetical protein